MGSVTVGGDAGSPMVAFIVAAVDRHMSALGFQKVETNPDLVVATDVWRGISYPAWWSDQWSGVDLNARKLVVGKIGVEVSDARTQKVVFRGSGQRSVSLKEDTNERKVDDTIDRIFAESPWGADFDD